jgi:hypothetical protein
MSTNYILASAIAVYSWIGFGMAVWHGQSATNPPLRTPAAVRSGNYERYVCIACGFEERTDAIEP